MMLPRSSRNISGFTLIEVIVALAILAVLSLLTSQAMQSGLKNRVWVSGEINREAAVADAMRIIRSDVTSAYHHRDITVTMFNQIITATPTPTPTPNSGTGGQPSGEQGAGQPQPQTAETQPQAPAATPRPTPVQVTGFSGDSESMYFTSLSNARVLRHAQESDQAKIGYYLKPCRSRAKPDAAPSSCLFRSVSPYLDDDVTKTGPESVLLEHVETFKLRYLSHKREDYTETWKTGEGSDASSKDTFPDAVEVTLTQHDKTDKAAKPVTMNALIPIPFTNNEKKKQTNTNGAAVDGNGAPAGTGN